MVRCVKAIEPGALSPDLFTTAQDTPDDGATVATKGSEAKTQGEQMATLNGTIKRLVSDKGFGFILASDGNEYFFHNSSCAQGAFDELREGEAVTFDGGQGAKGLRGENVRPS